MHFVGCLRRISRGFSAADLADASQCAFGLKGALHLRPAAHPSRSLGAVRMAAANLPDAAPLIATNAPQVTSRISFLSAKRTNHENYDYPDRHHRRTHAALRQGGQCRRTAPNLAFDQRRAAAAHGRIRLYVWAAVS